MDAGGLAQMSHPTFNPAANGLSMPSGLASRRGGQSIKPLSMDALKSPTAPVDNGAPTPRTSRSHLLAGLRTAPKSATAATFPTNPLSPTAPAPSQARNRNSMQPGMYDTSRLFNGPKTSMPQYSAMQQHQQQQQQPQAYNQGATNYGPHYTADQILAPPQLQVEENTQDPSLHAQLVAANAFLSEQQQRLQQQLRQLQAAAQQFQGMNLNSQAQMMQAYPNLYLQQQMHAMQPMMTSAMAQPSIYAAVDPLTGQQSYYLDQTAALNAQFVNQAQLNAYASLQQQQQQQQQPVGPPRVQVSPPPAENSRPSFRNNSPPRRYDSPIENPAPLPPPSANAFRRGHKKSSSLANANKGLAVATEEPPKSAGPKTASFPLTPLTAGYGPGQARAGEHPVRQPRNPPSLDELKAKPTARHEGSKNFVTRTRRSAINNLVKFGLERRKEARSSGSISPISESTEEILVETPLTDNDNDSESGRSGSGSLVENDDAECSLPSSRTSTGSWGAIGSDRPSSRQKTGRNSVDSNASSDNESASGVGSFASLLKSGGRLGGKTEVADGQRKAPMLVLTNAEKRKQRD